MPPEAEHFESYADRLIREAEKRGDFDDLPGRGEPLPDLDASYDPAWWARRLMARQRAADVEEEIRALRGERDPVKRAQKIESINRRIHFINQYLPESEKLTALGE